MVCRWKDAFFKDRETSNVAKNLLIEEVEKVMATTLPVSADGEETPAARRESSSSEPDTTTSGTTSIIAQMRKRIRLEQQQQVGVEEENSPKKVVEDYCMERQPPLLYETVDSESWILSAFWRDKRRQ